MRALVGIASMLAAIGLTGTVHAGPVEPLRPSEIVNLFTGAGLDCSSCGAGCREFNKQVNSAQIATFTGIPSGQVLVVTGVEWTGGAEEVDVVLQYGSSPGQYTELARYPTLTVAANGGGAVQGSSLFVVTLAPGNRLCLRPTSGVPTAHLHGYLTADR
jgi:hypothetical protein